jgi:hypothetical protein
MRYDYKQILDKLYTNVDGLGHFLTALGHLQMDSKDYYKLGYIGQEWRANHRPPVRSSQQAGWTLSPDIPLSDPPTSQELVDAKILIVSSYPTTGSFPHLLPLRLKQGDGVETRITRTHDHTNELYQPQTRGFLSLYLANDSGQNNAKVTLDCIEYNSVSENDVARIRLILHQNKIVLNDGTYDYFIDSYQPQDPVHIILQWDSSNVYAKTRGIFKRTLPLNEGNLSTGIYKFSIYTGTTGGNAAFVDGIITSLEGAAECEQYDNLKPGSINTPLLSSLMLRTEQAVTEDLIVNAEGDYKKPHGCIGQSWTVNQTVFSQISVLGGTPIVKSAFGITNHRKVLSLNSAKIGFETPVAQTRGSFDLFATYLGPSDYEQNYLEITTRDSAGNIKVQIRFGDGRILYYENNEWVHCGFYDQKNLSHISYGFDGNNESFGNQLIIEKGNPFYFAIQDVDSEYTDTIKSITIEAVGGEALLDSWGISWLGYRQFSNYSDGTAVVKQLLADSIQSAQLQSTYINVDSEGNFKLPPGIWGKNWQSDIDLTQFGWTLTNYPTYHDYEIYEMWYGHQKALWLKCTNDAQPFILRKAIPPNLTHLDVGYHIYPVAIATGESIEIGLVDTNFDSVAKLILKETDGKFYYYCATSETFAETPVSFVLNTWQHIRTEYDQSDIFGVFYDTIKQELADGTAHNSTTPAYFEIKMHGNGTILVVDAIGLSCYQYLPFTNVDDGIIKAKSIVTETGVFDIDVLDQIEEIKSNIQTNTGDISTNYTTISQNAADIILAEKNAVAALLDARFTLEDYNNYVENDTIDCDCDSCSTKGVINTANEMTLVGGTSAKHFQINMPQVSKLGCFQMKMAFPQVTSSSEISVVFYDGIKDIFKIRIDQTASGSVKIFLNDATNPGSEITTVDNLEHKYRFVYNIGGGSPGWHLNLDDVVQVGLFDSPFLNSPDNVGIVYLRFELPATSDPNPNPNQIVVDDLAFSSLGMAETLSNDAESNAITASNSYTDGEVDLAEKKAVNRLLNERLLVEDYNNYSDNDEINCGCGICTKKGIITNNTMELTDIDGTPEGSEHFQLNFPQITKLGCYQLRLTFPDLGSSYSLYYRFSDSVNVIAEMRVDVGTSPNPTCVYMNGDQVATIADHNSHEYRFVYDLKGGIPGWHLTIDGTELIGLFDKPFLGDPDDIGIEYVRIEADSDINKVIIDDIMFSGISMAETLANDAKDEAELNSKNYTNTEVGDAKDLTMIKTNLMNPEIWEDLDNFDSIGSFECVTESTNEIKWGINPFDEPSLIWKCPGAAANDNGWNYKVSKSKINADEAYRYMIFVKQTGSSNGTFSIGCGSISISTGTENSVKNLDESTLTEAWFYSGTLPEPNKWYLIVAYIHGNNDTGVSNQGFMFDLATGKYATQYNSQNETYVKIPITDFKWRKTTNWAKDFTNHRIRYQNGGTGNIILLYGPRIERIDANYGVAIQALLPKQIQDNAFSFTEKRTNLIPMENWVPCEDLVDVPELKGLGGGNNKIIRGETPFGDRGLLFEGTANIDANIIAGFQSTVSIEPDKTYRFMGFFKWTLGTGTPNKNLFIGFDANDNIKGVESGSTTKNYLVKAQVDAGKWYFVVGYIYDKDDSSVSQSYGFIKEVSSGNIISSFYEEDYVFDSADPPSEITFRCTLEKIQTADTCQGDKFNAWCPRIDECQTNMFYDLFNGLMEIKENEAIDYVKVENTPTSGCFDRTTTSPSATERLNFGGYFYATRNYNAVYNDFADFWQAAADVDPVPGKCYSFNPKGFCVVASGPKHFAGICSDTYGTAVGSANGNLPLSVAGFVLAFVDIPYPAGTHLVPDRDGNLTKGSFFQRLFGQTVAKYVRPEPRSHFKLGDQLIETHGRTWVKIIQ